MNVEVSCPQCGAAYTVRRDVLGKRTKCTRCGAAFTLAEAVPEPPRPPQPPPPKIPEAPRVATEPATEAPAFAVSPEFSGRRFAGSATRFQATRVLAIGFEILAVLVLMFLVIALAVLVVALVRTPDEIAVVIVTSGASVFWAALIAMGLFAIAQALRLGRAIEENTRDTKQACRQLADHLGGIEVEP